MFRPHHYSINLQPREWARQLLDRVRAGAAATPWQVNHALRITGDLPHTIEGKIHELEPVQAAQRSTGRPR